MYLFFNWVSSQWYIALLDRNKNIVEQKRFSIAWNESTLTTQIIDWFLKEVSVSYSDIENIICVVWPWSFTWIRTISLVVNTLSFIYPHIELTPVNFFDLYDTYPVIKSSSKRDLFVKMSESDIIEVMSNELFEEKCLSHTIYWDTNPERFATHRDIVSDINYRDIISNIEIKKYKTLAPLYIKKPNIS